MTVGAVADTHSTIWYVWGDPRMSNVAKAVFDDAAGAGRKIAVSSISLVEIAYLIEKRRIVPATLPMVLDVLRSGVLFREIRVSQKIIPAMAAIPRASVPDMPDRIIAATAADLGVPLVSRDRKIQASSVKTIW